VSSADPSDATAPVAEVPVHPLAKLAGDEKARLDALAALYAEASRLMAAFTKPDLLVRPKKYEDQVRTLSARFNEAQRHLLKLDAPIAALEAGAGTLSEELRKRTGRELKARCDAERIDFRVVSKEHPVEVRLVPFSVTLDFEKGQAQFKFARESLMSTPLDVAAIIDAYRQLERELGGPFDPKAFFAQLKDAYALALTRANRSQGDRVDIVDVLPFMALLRQSKSFLEKPERDSFARYTRAHFAFDIMRLREAQALEQDGTRVNLGVATGNSTSQKNRVVYVEDGTGVGEYKLSLFFSAT
jgi:hypothetical protein